jgi:hypothetical protein
VGDSATGDGGLYSGGATGDGVAVNVDVVVVGFHVELGYEATEVVAVAGVPGSAPAF